MRRRSVSLATPSSQERRRQLMNDYQHKSRQTVKMSLNKCGFELLVANLTFCIMSKMVRVHFPWPRRLQAFPEFFALCMAWIAAQARSGKFLDTHSATSASQGNPKPSTQTFFKRLHGYVLDNVLLFLFPLFWEEFGPKISIIAYWSPSIIAYRRSSNLRDLLVKAQLPVISTNHFPPGSFRCGQNCATCPYITNGLTSYTF